MNDFMLILILALGQIALGSFILRLIFGKSIMFFVSLQTVLFAMLYGYLNFLIGKMGVKTIFWAFPVYLGVGIAVYLYINHTLRKPLDTSIDQVKKLSEGDLKIKVSESKSQNELGVLNNSLKQLV